MRLIPDNVQKCRHIYLYPHLISLAKMLTSKEVVSCDSRNHRHRQQRAAERATPEPAKRGLHRLAAMLLPFAFGVVLTCGGFLIYPHISKPKPTFLSSSFNSGDAGCRTVAQLMAVSDAELENVDVVEMSLSVP